MKIIIGAGGKTQDGWKSTEQSELDILHRDDFERCLEGAIGFECILAEHVFEHIPEDNLTVAFRNCYDYLAVNGRLRIAVPDGFHPDKDYIDYVKAGNAHGHQFLFNHKNLEFYLRQAGFEVSLLEWWDIYREFHYKPWNEIDGAIERCLASDPRNQDGKPHYTSLIVDAFKMEDRSRPHLKDAFAFVEEHDFNRVSPFNRKKTSTIYELARLAPPYGVIVELGAHHGIGTAALYYGAKDGHRCKVIAVDAYKDMRGWANEPYTPEDMQIWLDNISQAKIYPILVQGDAHELSLTWKEPISLLVHDLGSKNRMPQDVLEWEKHIMLGGILAVRDIDDYSMGTEKAIENLLATKRWGNRRNWEAFITSVERIA